MMINWDRCLSHKTLSLKSMIESKQISSKEFGTSVVLFRWRPTSRWQTMWRRKRTTWPSITSWTPGTRFNCFIQTMNQTLTLFEPLKTLPMFVRSNRKTVVNSRKLYAWLWTKPRRIQLASINTNSNCPHCSTKWSFERSIVWNKHWTIPISTRHSLWLLSRILNLRYSILLSRNPGRSGGTSYRIHYVRCASKMQM